MEQDPGRLVERAAFNYLDIDPTSPPYSKLSDEQLADYYHQTALFNSGMWDWKRISDCLSKSAFYAQKIDKPERHGIWQRLFNHAQGAIDERARERLLKNSIIPISVASKKCLKFSVGLRFDMLVAESSSWEGELDALLKWKRFNRLFFEAPKQPYVLCALSIVYFELNKPDVSHQLLRWLQIHYPEYFRLEVGPGYLKSRIHYVRNLHPDFVVNRNSSLSRWKDALGDSCKYQIGEEYFDFHKAYRELTSNSEMDSVQLEDIHLTWRNFLKTILNVQELHNHPKVPMS